MFNSLKKEKFIMKAIVLFMTLLLLLCGCGGKGRDNDIDESSEKGVEDDYLYEEKVVAKHMRDDLSSLLSTNSEVIDIREKIKEASVYNKEYGLNSDCIVSFGEIKKGGSKGNKVNWIVLEKQNGKALLLSQEAMFYLNYSSNAYKNTLKELLSDENSEYAKLNKELKNIVEEEPNTFEKQKNKVINYENIQDKMNRILVSKMYDDYMRSACFSDDEYNLILNTSIDTKYYDRMNNENKETLSRKFFSMSKLETEKYFGKSNDKYENEKLVTETLNPLKSSKKSSKRKENVDYLLRDGAHYDIYINSELTIENTYGTKCMYVNKKGFIEPYGKYILSSEEPIWFRPMCIVEYEDNENDYSIINKKEKIERKLDKNKLKKDIDNANVVYNNKKAKTIEDYDSINFGGVDWIVIKKENGQALLQSKNVLFNKAFTQNQDTWYDSTLRKYLNTEFFDSFTNEEKKIICPTKLVLPLDEEFKNGIYYKELEKRCSYDKVFVLSPNEIEEYFDVDLHYGESNLERIKPYEYVSGINNLTTRTDDMDFAINSEMKLVYQHKKNPIGIRPCIVIKYDEKDKIIDEYTDEDNKYDILYFVNLVKNDIIAKYGKELAGTIHYVGRPIDYYDEDFVFVDSRKYYKGFENEDNVFPFFDEIRCMESSILGRIDLYINTNSKKYEFAFLLEDIDIDLNVSAFKKGIIKDELKNKISVKKNVKEEKQVKKQDDGIEILDKVTFGRHENYPLIWTVVDKDEEKYIILSDYTFDVKFNDKRKGFLKDDYGDDNKSNEILDKYFNGKELGGMIIDDEGNRYSLLGYKKYNELFTNREDRISLGCVTEENFGNKSYFVGGIGKYEKSINACDKNGDIYSAKDNFVLPNRVMVQVKKDVVDKIEGKNEVDIVDFVGDGGLYENYKTKNINFFGEDRLDRLAMFSNDLVFKKEEAFFVDYDGTEKPIKELSKVKEWSLKTGDIIYYGRFEKKNEDEIFSERMIYRVAEIKDNIALLHSVFALPVDKDLINTSNYKNSSIRNYLNGGFYSDSFEDEEKNKIIDSTVEYTDYDYQTQKLDDKIYLLSKEDINKFYTDLNIGTSLAYEILNTRSIIDEYTYLNENYDEYATFVDRQMQDLSYNFGWNAVNYMQKYPTNKLLETLNGNQYSNIFTTSTQDRNKYIMPSFKIKLGRQEDVANEMVALPDLSLLKYENRGFVYDGSLYYIDENKNLKVVEYYNNENEVNKDRIKTLFNNVGSLYKRNNKIYCVANMEYKDNYESGFGEWVGTLYLIENKNTYKEVYKNVCEVLHNVKDEKVYFYVDFTTGGRFIGEITINGKIYHLEKDKVYDDKNKFVNSIIDITNKISNNENIEVAPSDKKEDNPLNISETYDRYIEFMGNYYLGWYDKKIKFDDYFELKVDSKNENANGYENLFNELKGQELAYRGEDILLKENDNYKTLSTNIIEYYKLNDNSFAVVYEPVRNEKIDFIDFLEVENLSKNSKVSAVKDKIYFELKNYLIRKNGGKMQIYNNDKFYDVINSQNIKYGSWFLNHYDGWYVKDFIGEEVYDLTFDGINYTTTDLGFKMRYSIHIYKNGNMLYAMINDKGKFDILLYDRKENHFIQEMDFKTYEAVVVNDKVEKLKSYKNNLHDIDLSNYQ